ncbi:hypothetical protein ACI3EJ_03205 [Ligilactobacillus acidipiscis]|jgi:chemotaxis protein CheY-P-specific phosphatase CheC|uniref:hypothetical protein n=1 Tax=Ligilactobacillus acidipiscis TaxID=89059 RepID=UPI003862EACA
MVQQNNDKEQKRLDNIKYSSFAEAIHPKATPIENVLHKPLELATGSIFKVLSGSEETVQDSDGNKSSRAVYRVQSLNSQLLPLSTEFEVKVKAQPCLIKKEDNFQILFNSKMVVATFENLSHWTFNGREGLNANSIRILNLTKEQIMTIVENNTNA